MRMLGRGLENGNMGQLPSKWLIQNHRLRPGGVAKRRESPGKSFATWLSEE